MMPRRAAAWARSDRAGMGTAAARGRENAVVRNPRRSTSSLPRCERSVTGAPVTAGASWGEPRPRSAGGSLARSRGFSARGWFVSRVAWSVCPTPCCPAPPWSSSGCSGSKNPAHFRMNFVLPGQPRGARQWWAGCTAKVGSSATGLAADSHRWFAAHGYVMGQHRISPERPRTCGCTPPTTGWIRRPSASGCIGGASTSPRSQVPQRSSEHLAQRTRRSRAA